MPSPASSPSSFPLFPTISLILSCIFCLYRLQGPIRTYCRRFDTRHSGQNEYARLATVEDGTPSPPPSANLPLPLHENPTPGRTDNIPTTPLSKYFDPQTALLYADVFERRTIPPTLRGEVEVRRGQQLSDSDSDSDSDTDAGVWGNGDRFERLVQGVVRYYEGLVWGKALL